MVNKPTVISTFAGCGGSSLGYHLAGFKELLAVEWEDNAAATFRLNFPGVPLFHGDIAKLSVDECLNLAGIKSGELDIFDGSPPCQGFSMAGARRYNDPRNSLFKEYCRLLTGLRPKAFVMENVTGMVRGVMKQAYLACVNELRACGYSVSGQILCAQNYGVPSSRQRVIIIGTRNDLAVKPSHPKPQTKQTSVAAALLGLPTESDFKLPGTNALALIKQCKPGESASKYHHSGSYFNLIKAPLNKPCPTITKTPNLIHPIRGTFFSINEIKRLQSFPDDFKFFGSFEEQWNRIGNSVPPNMMKYIAEHIKTNILSM